MKSILQPWKLTRETEISILPNFLEGAEEEDVADEEGVEVGGEGASVLSASRDDPARVAPV